MYTPWIRFLLGLSILMLPNWVHADETVPLIATLRTNGEPVQVLAFDSDGHRLAAGFSNAVLEGNRFRNVPTEAVVWEVDAKKELCRIKGDKEKSLFNHLWLSSSGDVLVTVKNGIGIVDGNVKVRVNTGIRSGGQYQAWDIATGKLLGKPIAPAGTGEFVTAALSQDGKWLATVYHEMVTGEKAQPIKPFKVNQIDIWDIQGHKVIWKHPGTVHTGKVTWHDSLAFAPDSHRLAVWGMGISSSELAKLSPDRRSQRSQQFRVLTLENGQEVPTVTIPEASSSVVGTVEWLSSGKWIVVRNGRTVDVFDSASFKRGFDYVFPLPMHQKSPNPSNPQLPIDWYEPQSILSADGSRLATHFIHDLENKKIRQNYVTLWDTRERKILGSVQFAEQPLDTRRSAANKDVTSFTTFRFALSGDGKRLAVCDRSISGAVRVYDVTKVSGLIKAGE